MTQVIPACRRQEFPSGRGLHFLVFIILRLDLTKDLLDSRIAGIRIDPYIVSMSGTNKMLREYEVNISSISALLGDNLVLVFPKSLYLKRLACDYADCDALTGHLNASDVNRLISYLSSYAHMSKGGFESAHSGLPSEPVNSFVVLAL